MHVVKNIQIPFFFFFLVIILCFLEIFKAREFGMGFFEVNFWSRDYLGGGGGKRGFVGSPRDFFWRGVDFVPIQSSPSLEIFISWKTF